MVSTFEHLRSAKGNHDTLDCPHTREGGGIVLGCRPISRRNRVYIGDTDLGNSSSGTGGTKIPDK